MIARVVADGVEVGVVLVPGLVRETVLDRVFQAVHFGMQHRAAFLHSLIVSATDDCAIDHQHRADRDSTRSLSLLRFCETA